MKILVACEESQRVCTEFRKRGHEAYSCDIIDCSGGHPEWHIKGDVLPLINGNCVFQTVEGGYHSVYGKWDMIIAFPPCTYLTAAATQCHSLKKKTREQIAERTLKRIEAMNFFMTFINADCEKIAVENPIGTMNTAYRKPEQIIQPYYFAESENDEENYNMKTTCLWLKGLDTLKYNENIKRPEPLSKDSTGHNRYFTDSKIRDAETRSKTFPGIAKAMAEQWG